MLPNVSRTSAADHVPVLAEEVRGLLAVQPGETVVDGTFGAGGHSRLLAADLAGQGKLVAIDRDPTVRPYFDRVKASARIEATAHQQLGLVPADPTKTVYIRLPR